MACLVNSSNKKVFMNVNVILTFSSCNEYGDTQEFFDLALPVSKSESHSAVFIGNKLFTRISKKCKHLNRRAEDLIKISTASNWDVFKKTTNLPSLCDLGHDCKWYFGIGRNDLDAWEQSLMLKHNFGTEADMSWVNDARPVQVA